MLLFFAEGGVLGRRPYSNFLASTVVLIHPDGAVGAFSGERGVFHQQGDRLIVWQLKTALAYATHKETCFKSVKAPLGAT